MLEEKKKVKNVTDNFRVKGENCVKKVILGQISIPATTRISPN